MIQTKTSDKIQYLLRIKFPGGLHPQPLRQNGSCGGTNDATMKLIKAEQMALWALSDVEIARLCAFEFDARSEREEKAHFFNQPAANADFGYWSTVEYWTLDETIALLLGKNPEVVHWKIVEPYLNAVNFAQKERQSLGISTPAANADPGFAKRYELLRKRAMRADVLNPASARVDPVVAMEWARQTGCISISAPLEAAVIGRMPQPVQSLVTAPATVVTLKPQAAPVMAVGASGGVEPDKTGPAKPMQRTAAQDCAILSEIQKNGYDPLALPKNLPGKPGVKAATRAALLKNSLFTGGTVFDKAWERLTARADIAIKG